MIDYSTNAIMGYNGTFFFKVYHCLSPFTLAGGSTDL